jgi:hypothetical protein
MAIYAQFDEAGECIQLASNTGWSEFIDWVETLDGYKRLSQLVDEANCEDIAGLRDELESCLEDEPPENKDVLDVAHQVIHAIDAGGKAEIMLITSGVTQEPEKEDKAKTHGVNGSDRKRTQVSGGHWVTIEGHHVFIGGQNSSPSTSRGGKISSAIENKSDRADHEAAVNHALKQIDKVHGGGDELQKHLGKIAVYSDVDSHLAPSATGGYVKSGMNTHGILLSNRDKHVDHEMTTIHEIGHFLNHQALGTHGNGVASDEGKIPELMKAINKGKGVKQLDSLAKSKAGGSYVNYAKYAVDPDEKFARAYSHYIAAKTGDPVLLKQLAKERGGAMGPMLYHSDEEFKPVIAEFDKLFENKGMKAKEP